MSFFEIIKKEEDLDELVEEVIDEDTEISDDLIVERDDLQDAFESAKKFYNGILSSFNKLEQIREGIEFIKDGKKIKSFSTKTDIKSKISRKEMQTLLSFINYVKDKDDDFTVTRLQASLEGFGSYVPDTGVYTAMFSSGAQHILSEGYGLINLTEELKALSSEQIDGVRFDVAIKYIFRKTYKARLFESREEMKESRRTRKALARSAKELVKTMKVARKLTGIPKSTTKEGKQTTGGFKGKDGKLIPEKTHDVKVVTGTEAETGFKLTGKRINTLEKEIISNFRKISGSGFEDIKLLNEAFATDNPEEEIEKRYDTIINRLEERIQEFLFKELIITDGVIVKTKEQLESKLSVLTSNFTLSDEDFRLNTKDIINEKIDILENIDFKKLRKTSSRNQKEWENQTGKVTTIIKQYTKILDELIESKDLKIKEPDVFYSKLRENNKKILEGLLESVEEVFSEFGEIKNEFNSSLKNRIDKDTPRKIAEEFVFKSKDILARLLNPSQTLTNFKELYSYYEKLDEETLSKIASDIAENIEVIEGFSEKEAPESNLFDFKGEDEDAKESRLDLNQQSKNQKEALISALEDNLTTELLSELKYESLNFIETELEERKKLLLDLATRQPKNKTILKTFKSAVEETKAVVSEEAKGKLNDLLARDAFREFSVSEEDEKTLIKDFNALMSKVSSSVKENVDKFNKIKETYKDIFGKELKYQKITPKSKVGSKDTPLETIPSNAPEVDFQRNSDIRIYLKGLEEKAIKNVELFSLLSAIEQLKITEVIGNSIAAIDAIYSEEPDIKFKKYAKSKSVSEVVKRANKLNSEVVVSFSDSVLLKAFNSDNMEKAVIRLIESKVPKRITVENKLQEAVKSFPAWRFDANRSGSNRIEIIQKIIDDQKAMLSEQTPKYEGAFGTKELRSEVEAKEIGKISDKLQKTISVIAKTVEAVEATYKTRQNRNFRSKEGRVLASYLKNRYNTTSQELIDTYKERLNALESALEKTGDEEE
tara:strand:+ start:10642 stop:13641 length:3000 start_codon:yes stop_codon:yes gene_type:complete